MIREALRIYLLDIIFTCVSFYVLFNSWEDTNISSRTIKIIKWAIVLFIWIFSTIPTLLDLARALNQSYVVMTGEVIKGASPSKDTRNVISVFDTSKSGTISLTIMPTTLYKDAEVGDSVTIEYLPHGKYGKVTEISNRKGGIL